MYKQTLYQTSPTSLSSALEEGTIAMTGNVDTHPMLYTQENEADRMDAKISALKRHNEEQVGTELCQAHLRLVSSLFCF